MSCIGLTALISIIGIFLFILGFYLFDNAWYESIKEKIGELIGIIFGIISIISVSFLIYFISLNISLPLKERDFKVKYNSVKEMKTLSTDLRDASYTKELLEINKEINNAREYCNDPFFGCINSEEIANYELLNKE